MTWSEIYRGIDVCSLVIVLGALHEAPGIGGVDALLWTSLFLGVFAVLLGYQLWTNRTLLWRGLRNW